jgi:hypothetical protein
VIVIKQLETMETQQVRTVAPLEDAITQIIENRAFANLVRREAHAPADASDVLDFSSGLEYLQELRLSLAQQANAFHRPKAELVSPASPATPSFSALPTSPPVAPTGPIIHASQKKRNSLWKPPPPPHVMNRLNEENSPKVGVPDVIPIFPTSEPSEDDLPQKNLEKKKLTKQYSRGTLMDRHRRASNFHRAVAEAEDRFKNHHTETEFQNHHARVARIEALEQGTLHVGTKTQSKLLAIEAAMEQLRHEEGLQDYVINPFCVAGMPEEIRLGFLKKVFGIMAVQQFFLFLTISLVKFTGFGLWLCETSLLP